MKKTRTLHLLGRVLAVLLLVSPALSAQPAAYYPFDEGSGMVATDATGNGYHGDIQGSTTYVAGVSGTALQFGGTASVELPRQVFDSFGDEAYGEAWIRVDSLPNFPCVGSIFVKRAHFNDWNLRVRWDGKFASDIFDETFADAISLIGGETTFGDWFKVGSWFDGSALHLLINDEIVKSVSNEVDPDWDASECSDGFGLGCYHRTDIGNNPTDTNCTYDLRGAIDELVLSPIAPDYVTDPILLFDGFEDGDEQDWLTFAAGWSESSGEYHATNTSANVRVESIYADGVGNWSDYSAEVDLTPLSSHSPVAASLLIRWTVGSIDPNQSLAYCGLFRGQAPGLPNSTYLRLLSRHAGVQDSEYVQFNWSPGQTYRLRATAVGDILTCEIEGEPQTRIVMENAPIALTGTVGLRSTHIRSNFDNVLVIDLSNPNNPPVADAGLDQTLVADAQCEAEIILDGAGSFDTDGAITEWLWTDIGGGQLSGEIVLTTSGVGTETFDLEVVDDAGATATDSVAVEVVDTTAPLISLVGDSPVVHQCGVAFVDPGAQAHDNCTVDVTVATSGNTVSGLVTGSFDIFYSAVDAAGNAANQVARVVDVVDTQVPAVANVSASPSLLWPPNHKMKTVAVAADVSDACGAASCSIVDVTGNEPIDGPGDGSTAPDWEIVGPLKVKLRAERAGGGIGRVYTVHLACVDEVGNANPATVEVVVPHNR